MLDVIWIDKVIQEPNSQSKIITLLGVLGSNINMSFVANAFLGYVWCSLLCLSIKSVRHPLALVHASHCGNKDLPLQERGRGYETGRKLSAMKIQYATGKTEVQRISNALEIYCKYNILFLCGVRTYKSPKQTRKYRMTKNKLCACTKLKLVYREISTVGYCGLITDSGIQYIHQMLFSGNTSYPIQQYFKTVMSTALTTQVSVFIWWKEKKYLKKSCSFDDS